MPRANYGFRGDSLTPSAAIAAGATVSGLDYTYNVGLGVITALTPPGQVTGLTLTASSGQVALSWTAPGSVGSSAITSYDVEITPSGGSATVVNTGSTSTSYTATSLTNGTSYGFRVRANNGTAGDGDWSGSSSATPSGTANFKSPTSGWTSIFGSTTSTSGSASTPYTASVSNFTFTNSSTVTTARSGTLRVTGTVTSDSAFQVISGSTVLGNVGDSSGNSGATINFSVSVLVDTILYIDCSFATISNLQIWLV
jgi:hypothetical protein